MGMAAGGIAQGLGAGAQAYGAYKTAQLQSAQQENAVTHLYDSTNPVLKDLIGKQAGFFTDVLGGVNPLQNRVSPLQDATTQQLSGMVGATTPQDQALASLSPQLMSFISAQGSGAANPFTQALANPFAATQGVENPGQQVIDAYRPIFQQQLQQANGQLASSAPGRFSTAFEQQGIDLNARALQDFNLFAGQQLQAGAQLQAQQQAQAQNFLLGARGLAQDATLQQGAQQAQNFLGGAGLYGQIASQFGNDQLSRALGLSGAGQALTAQQQAPMLQLLLASAGYAQPADLNAVIGGRGIEGGVYNPGGAYGSLWQGGILNGNGLLPPNTQQVVDSGHPPGTGGPIGPGGPQTGGGPQLPPPTGTGGPIGAGGPGNHPILAQLMQHVQGGQNASQLALLLRQLGIA